MHSLMSFLDHSSLLISVASLMVAVASARRGSRGTQLQHCLDLVRIFEDAYEAVALADDKSREIKLIRLVNILENMALFVNRGIVTGPAKEAVENLLRYAIATHVCTEVLDSKIKLSHLNDPSFKEIARFHKKNAAAIAVLAKSLLPISSENHPVLQDKPVQ